MRQKLTRLFSLALLAALLAPQSALAATSIEQVVSNLRVWLVGMLVALATLLLTIGGVRYLLAGGDPGQIEKAKSAIKAALVGYALAALAPVLVSVAKQIVGG